MTTGSKRQARRHLWHLKRRAAPGNAPLKIASASSAAPDAHDAGPCIGSRHPARAKLVAEEAKLLPLRASYASRRASLHIASAMTLPRGVSAAYSACERCRTVKYRHEVDQTIVRNAQLRVVPWGESSNSQFVVADVARLRVDDDIQQEDASHGKERQRASDDVGA